MTYCLLNYDTTTVTNILIYLLSKTKISNSLKMRLTRLRNVSMPSHNTLLNHINFYKKTYQLARTGVYVPPTFSSLFSNALIKCCKKTPLNSLFCCQPQRSGIYQSFHLHLHLRLSIRSLLSYISYIPPRSSPALSCCHLTPLLSQPIRLNYYIISYFCTVPWLVLFSLITWSQPLINQRYV